MRKPALLRQVFAIGASYPAEIVSLQKIQGRLQDAGALATIVHYLGLLEEAFLIAGLEKHSARALRRRAAPPKRVTYWRAEPFEVDGVLEGSWGSFAIEVKTGAIETSDLRGLLEFRRRYPRYRPLVICDDPRHPAIARAEVEAIGWRDFLLTGPPRAAT